jgi:hypothetical protein
MKEGYWLLLEIRTTVCLTGLQMLFIVGCGMIYFFPSADGFSLISWNFVEILLRDSIYIILLNL